MILSIRIHVHGEEDLPVEMADQMVAVKYYLPANSVIEWAALRKNEVRTACPYKGEAW